MELHTAKTPSRQPLISLSDKELDPCECDDLPVFDIGTFVFETVGRYLSSGGTEWNVDPCNGIATEDCEHAVIPFLDWRDDPNGDAYDMDALR
jgi:hypothetical protein